MFKPWLKFFGMVFLFSFAMGLALTMCERARADGFTVLRVERAPATAPGRWREPSAHRFYESRPTINLRPRALVLGFDGWQAPANGCERQGGGFLAVSGRFAGRCFGAVQ